MLNKNKERELAYVVTIDDLKPIEGKDRVECAVVGGWNIMVRKEQFKVGDPAIYFEIDSKVPDTKPFEFLAPKKYKIKTQKYGSFYSQGLLMSAEDFGWKIGSAQFAGDAMYIEDDQGAQHFADDVESMFLTKQLGVTYYDPMDRARKSSNNRTEYKPIWKKVKNWFPFKQLMRTKIGRKVLLKIFGVKKKKKHWPYFMPHSDQERIQNMKWILENKTPFIATEKVDGCSSGFTVCKNKFGKLEYCVCSRNVVLTRNQKTYYDDMNVWFEMYDKYNIKDFLTDFIKETKSDWVYLQGESFGTKVQKRDYSLDGHDFRAFELCTSNRVRYTYSEMKEILDRYNIPTVPIIDTNYILPNTVEELIAFAHGDSAIDGKAREGIVFQNIEDSTISFKAVDPEFLIKYHGG